MAFTKITSFQSLALFLVFLTTITSPKLATAQTVNLSTNILNISAKAICSPTVFVPNVAGILGQPLANITVEIRVNNITIGTGVTTTNGSLSIVIPAGTVNVTQPINIANITATVNIPSVNCNLVVNPSVLTAVLVPVGSTTTGVVNLLLQLVQRIV